MSILIDLVRDPSLARVFKVFFLKKKYGSTFAPESFLPYDIY
jgi:hypothetical protein